MQYVIITFRQVIFSDASTSGLKSELIINSFMIACFRGNFQCCSKTFYAESFDKIKNCALVQIQAKWGREITEVWLFWSGPFRIYLNTFCKTFRLKPVHQIKWILWLFGLKTCKDDSYMQKENLFIENVPENHILLLLKKPVTVEYFLSPNLYFYFTFCHKSWGYLGLNQSSNLETDIFLGLIIIKKWKAFGENFW